MRLCGKARLGAVRTPRAGPLGASPVRLDTALLALLPDRLRAARAVFGRTGGCHAAALRTGAGELLDVREDVGRRNAVGKLVGRALRDGRSRSTTAF